MEHSRASGRTHNHCAWNFETLSILESKGYFCPEMNLDFFIERALSLDDIHLKGVALRYRALRNWKPPFEEQDSCRPAEQ